MQGSEGWRAYNGPFPEGVRVLTWGGGRTQREVGPGLGGQVGDKALTWRRVELGSAGWEIQAWGSG